MQRLISPLLACALLVLAGACARHAPPETANTAATNASAPAAPTERPTPEHIVTASADAVTLKAGARADAQVRLQIAEGYHINANPATFSYLRETKVEVAAADGLAVEATEYPPPVTRQFRFEKKPLKVYEHEAAIRLRLHAAANATQGAHTLRAQVQVQACDEEKCFPPTTLATDIPVTIN